jgi:hypothetical protein
MGKDNRVVRPHGFSFQAMNTFVRHDSRSPRAAWALLRALATIDEISFRALNWCGKFLASRVISFAR